MSIVANKALRTEIYYQNPEKFIHWTGTFARILAFDKKLTATGDARQTNWISIQRTASAIFLEITKPHSFLQQSSSSTQLSTDNITNESAEEDSSQVFKKSGEFLEEKILSKFTKDSEGIVAETQSVFSNTLLISPVPSNRRNIYLNSMYEVLSKLGLDTLYPPMEDNTLLESFIGRILKDCDSTETNPATRVGTGKNGPTVILEYLRINNAATPSPYKAVLKWASASEFSAGLLYSFLAEQLPQNAQFFVPKAAFVDTTENYYIDGLGNRSNLNGSSSVSLKKYFKAILRDIGGPTETTVENEIMLMQRLVGSTLLEFTQGTEGKLYNKLSPHQKESLFRQMGAIIFVDFLVRQLDRSIMFDIDGDKFDLNTPSNIGNFMIVMPEDDNEESPLLYAIDNDISLSEYENEENHNNFLIQTLQNPETMLQTLTETAVACLNESFKNYSVYMEDTFHSSQTRTVAIKKAQTFLSDLNQEETGVKFLREGISVAFNTLKTTQPEDIEKLNLSPKLNNMLLARFAKIKETQG